MKKVLSSSVILSHAEGALKSRNFLKGLIPVASLLGKTVKTAFLLLAISCMSLGAYAQNYAVSFNGSSQYISATPDITTLASSGTLTLEAWINPTSTSLTTQSFIVSYGSSTSAFNEIALGLNGTGKLCFAENQSGTYAEVDQTSATLVAGTWAHVAAVKNGTSITLYINGVSVGTGTISSAPSSLNLFNVATLQDGSGFHHGYDGDVDEVRAWNIARSGNAIACDMDNTLTGSESGLTIYYNFNDGSTATNNASSGSTYNGTLAGSPSFITSGATVYSSALSVGPTNNSPIYTSGTVTLTSNASGGSGSYDFLWSGTSLVSTTSDPTTATPSTPGSIVYSVTVTDATTTCTVNGTTTVTVNPITTTKLYPYSGGTYNANVLTDWTNDPTGASESSPFSSPANFTTSADTFYMNHSMNTSATWTVSGTVIVHGSGSSSYLFTPANDVTVGGAFILENGGGFAGSVNLNLSGNLTVGSLCKFSTFSGDMAINFNGTAIINWPSTTFSNSAQLVIGSGAVVTLASNLLLPASYDAGYSNVAVLVNTGGTLDCGTYSMGQPTSSGTNALGFTLSGGATLKTANTNSSGAIYGILHTSITGGVALTGTISLPNNANYVFDGTSAQHTGTGTYGLPASVSGGSVTIQNAAGVTLDQTTTVDVINLNSGVLTLGTNNLTLSSYTGGSSSASYINASSGEVTENISTTTTYTYPIGDASNYTPVSLNFTAGTFSSSTASVYVTPSADYSAASDYLNRYWTVNLGGSGSGLTYNATATYVAGDVVGTAANISMAESPNGSTSWTKYAAANTSAKTITTTGGSGITDLTAYFTGIPSAVPSFDGGGAQNLAVCENSGATSINSLLTASETTGFTFTWSVSSSPTHGTLGGFNATASSGTSITPSGLTYTPNTSYSGPDAFTIQVSDGANSTTTTITVTVNPSPTVNTIAGVAYCSGSSASAINFVDPGNTGTTFTWTSSVDIGFGTSGSTATIAAFTASAASVTIATITATPTALTCVGSATAVTTITVNPAPSISAGASPTSIYYNGSSTSSLSASGSSVSYSWYPTTNLSASTATPVTFTPAGVGNVTYTVTGTGTNSCTNTATVTVTVNVLPTTTTKFYPYSGGTYNANVLTDWTNDPTGASETGSYSSPGNFTTSADTFVMTVSMSTDPSTTSGTWTVAGYVEIGTMTTGVVFDPNGDVTIGGALTLGNDANWYNSGATDPVNINLAGNLNVLGTSSFTASTPAFYIVWCIFNFTGTSNITWTSSGSSAHADLYIGSGASVTLLSNLPLPKYGSVDVYGSVYFGTWQMYQTASETFTLEIGATLETQNTDAGGAIYGALGDGFTPIASVSLDGGASYIFDGTSAQHTGTGGYGLPAAVSGTVTINNSGGVILDQTTILPAGTLALTSGVLTLGSNNLFLGNYTGGSSASYIDAHSTGGVAEGVSIFSTYTYPVGDASNYTPISLNFTSVSGGSPTASVNVTPSKEPHNADGNNYLNRYWTVALSATGMTYNATATFVTADEVVTGLSDVSMGEYNGTAWKIFGTASSTAGGGTISTTGGVSDQNADFTGISNQASVSVSTPATICSGGSATLTASPTDDATGGAGLTYTWSPNTSLSATTGSPVSANPSATTIYTVTMTDGNGITATTNVTVTNSGYAITATAGSNGSISPSGVTCVSSSQVYTITPGGGYAIDSLIVDGASVPAVSTYTFTSVSATHTIRATFATTCTLTFTETGSVQTWTVPAGVTGISVDVSGGSGGANTTPTAGGSGGRVTATLAVTPGQVLTINVGGAGGTASAGYNGGGTSSGEGGGGGGASDILIGSTPLIVAGGGGGSGGGTGGAGGAGGGLTGAAGVSIISGGGGGGGGTQSAGGAGGVTTPSTDDGGNGASGTGGNGNTVATGHGGGGGGGYYGGGGGSSDGIGSSQGGGGGGGSSYTDPTLATSVSHTQGYNSSGNGVVYITVPFQVSGGANTTTCSGVGVALTAIGANTYTWTPSSSLSASTGASVTASPTATTTYTITGTNTNSSCSGTATVTVSINPAPLPTLTNATNTSPVCTGGSVTLNANSPSVDVTGYTWTGPDAITSSTSQNATIASATTSGIYTVAITNSTCTATYTTAVTVNPTPTVNTRPAFVYCSGTVSAGINFVDPGNTGATFTWTSSADIGFGTSGTSSIAAFTTSAASVTIATITATPTALTCVGSATIVTTKTVNPLPSVSGLTITGASNVCQNTAATINYNNSSLSTGTYTFTYSTSNPSASGLTTMGVSVTASTAGTFNTGSLTHSGSETLTLTSITDANSCISNLSASNTATFSVNPVPAYTSLSAHATGDICSGTVDVVNLSSTTLADGTYTIEYDLTNFYGTGSGTVSATLVISGGSGSGSFNIPTTGLTTAYSPYTVNIDDIYNTCSDPGLLGTGPYHTSFYVHDQPQLYGLTPSGSTCYNASSTSTVNFPFVGCTAPYYDVTWTPTGQLTDLTGFTTSFPGTSPLTITVPAGAAANSYSGALTIYDPSNGCTNSYTMTLTVNPDPAASSITTSGTTVCAGVTGTVNVLSTSLADGSYIVTYNVGGGASQTASLTISSNTGYFSVPSSLLSSGSNTINLISVAYSSTSCSTPFSGSPTETITQNAPILSSLSGPANACSGSNFTLTANSASGGISSYTYNWGGAGISASSTSGNTNTANYGTSGNQTYSVTVSSAGCTSGYYTATVSIDPLPSTVTASGAGTFCGSTSISASGGSGGAIYYEGTTSGGTSTGLGGTPQTVSASGTYYFNAESSAGCWGTQGSVTVSINPLPSAITGNTTLSTAITTTLADATGGGTWSSVSTAVGTIDPSTGIVTGLSTGTSVISYTLTGCAATTMVNVLTPDAALNFNGSSTYIQPASTITLGTNDFTFEAWINPLNFSAPQLITAEAIEANVYNQFLIWINTSGQLVFVLTDATNTNALHLTSASSVTANIWSHVAFVRSGSNQYTYINGILVASGTSSLSTPIDNEAGTVALQPWLIGAYSDGSGGALTEFNGSIDEFRYWNVARTQSQIQANMNCDVAQQSNLQAYYRFNEGTAGGTNTGIGNALDYSGNYNCGVLHNFALTGASANYETGAIGSCNSISLTLPAASNTGTPSICGTGTTTLTNSVSGGTWTTSSSNVTLTGTTSATVTVTGVTAGTAPVTYTLNCGTAITVVTVNPIPTVNTIAGVGYCSGTSGSAINFVDPGNTGATFTWTSSADIGFGTSGTSNIAAFTATPTSLTVATITATPTALTCVGSPTAVTTITVNPIPSISAGASPNPIYYNGSSTSSLSASGSSVSYAWSPSTYISASAGTPVTFTPSGPGNVTYTVTGTATGGCTNTATVTVTVNVLPTTSTKFYTYTGGGSGPYYADNTSYWTNDPTGATLTPPANFTNSNDTFVVTTSMITTGAWNVSGNVQVGFITSGVYFQPVGDVTIGGYLMLGNNAWFVGSSGTDGGNPDLNVNLSGDLFETGTGFFYDNYNYMNVNFVGSSTQHINWANTTSIGGQGPFGFGVQVNINSGASVVLQTDLGLSDGEGGGYLPGNYAIVVNNGGTLDVGTHVITDAVNDDEGFDLAGGGTLKTANTNGNGAIYGSLYSGAISGTVTLSGGANYVYEGSGTQYIGSTSNDLPGLTSGGNVTINKTGGSVSLLQSTDLSGGTLTLTSENLVLNGNNLTIQPTGGSGSSYIQMSGFEEVFESIPTSGTYNYPSGDASGNYSPLSLVFSSASGNVAGVKLHVFKDGGITESTNYLNRFWNVGTTGSGFSYSATGTYVSSDIVGTDADIAAGYWTGSADFRFGPANTSAKTITTGSITNGDVDIIGLSNEETTGTVSVSANPVCQGGANPTLSSSASSDAGITNYSWTSPDGGHFTGTTSGSSVPTATIDATYAGTHTYSLTITDGDGLQVSSGIVVTVNPTPTVNTIAGVAYCSGTSASAINFVDPGNTGATFTWTSSADIGFGTSGTGNIAAFTATPTSLTVATITVTPTALTCVGSATVVTAITVNPLPSISAGASPNPIYYNGTSTSSLSASGSSVSYAWSPSTGLSASAGTPVTFTPSGTGNITYSVTGTDANSCTNTTTVTVTVNVLPTTSHKFYPLIGSSLNANDASAWTNDPTGVSAVGTANFTITTDSFEMSRSMSSSGSWSVSGDVEIGGFPGVTFTPTADVSFKGPVTVDQDAYYYSGSVGAMFVYGDLTVSGTARFNISVGGGAYHIISFTPGVSNTTNLTWTSTNPSNDNILQVASGQIVTLMSNLPMPTFSFSGVNTTKILEVAGTLVCGTYNIGEKSGENDGVQIDAFGVLVTANTSGSGAMYGSFNTSFTLGSSYVGFSNVSFSGAAEYVFNGSSAQHTGTGTFGLPATLGSGSGALTIYNSAGVTLDQTTDISGGSLYLTLGNLILGSNNLTLASTTGSSSSYADAHGSGMVIESTTGIYPIGDGGGNYTPVTVTFNSGSGTVGANVTASKESHNNDAANYLNRYWSVTATGGVNYDVSATYVAGDVNGSAADITMGEWTGSSPWKIFGAGGSNPITTSGGVTDATANFTGISNQETTGTISATVSSVCAGGGNPVLSSSASSDATGTITYSWSSPDGGTYTGSTSGATATVNAATAGSHTYSLTITDGNGLQVSSGVVVTVNALPSASFTPSPDPVCYGNAVTFTSGAPLCSGEALTFAGTNSSKASLGGLISTATSNITMEAWIYWSGNTSHNQMIMSNGNSACSGYTLFLESGTGYLSIVLGNVTVLQTAFVPAASTWTHVAATYDGSTWYIYANGVSQSYANETANPPVPITPTTTCLTDGGNGTVGFYIGDDPGNSANQGFNGNIDEVKFWTTARSGSQVATDMNACYTAPQSGLIGNWPFNEGTGTTTADASGNGHNLTLSSTTWVAAGETLSTYAWSFGDAATSSINGVAHTYTAAGTYTASLTVTNSNGCMASSSQPVTMNPTPTVNTITGVAYCNGASASAINFVDPGNTGATFTWTSSADIGFGTSGSTASIAAFTATNTGASPVIATVTATPSALACTGSATVVTTITVNPLSGLSAGSNTSICLGTPTTLTASGTTTYTWAPSGSLSASTGSSVSANPSVTTTYTLTGTNVGGCTGTTTVTVTVNSVPTVNPVSDAIYCNGTSVSGGFAFSGSTGTTFSWTSTADIGFGTTSGSGSISTFTTSIAGSSPVVATITVTPSTAYCTGSSTGFTVTVNPTPTVNSIGSQVICSGDIAATVTPSGVATTYNWTNDQSAVDGLAASGTNTSLVFSASSNTGSSPVIGNFVVTPVYVNSITCTGATPTGFTVTVNPTPTVSSIGSQVICSGDIAATVTPSGVATTYNWTNDQSAVDGLLASGTNTSLTFGASSNSGSSPVIGNISVTPVYVNSITCTGASPTGFTVTVNPTPTVSSIGSQVICSGDIAATVTPSGVATTYNWTNDQSAVDGLLASGTNTSLTFGASSNSGSSPVIGNISVTPVYVNSITCTGTSPTGFTVTVNPTPTVNSIGSQVICSGATATTVTPSGVATTYNWTNDQSAVDGLLASGSNTSLVFGASSNTGSSPVIGNISVTPVYVNSITCTGATPTGFTVTVNPTPTVTISGGANQAVCNTAPTAAITFTGIATAFNWTNDNTAINLGSSGVGNIGSFTATNGGATTIGGNIAVTAVYVNSITCTGNTVNTTLSVNPSPTSTGATVSLTPICLTGTVTLSANTTNANTWVWSGSDGSGYTGATPSVTPTVTGTIVYSLTASNSGTGCYALTTYTTSLFVKPTSPGPSVANLGVNGRYSAIDYTTVIKVSSKTIPASTYLITYNLSGANVIPGATSTMSFTGGLGQFVTPVLPNGGTTGVTLISIQDVFTSCLTNISAPYNSASFSVHALGY